MEKCYNSQAMKSIYRTKTPEETIELGKKLAINLHSQTILLLFGDLGTGKTHLTKGIASGLGIMETIKSPTYIYVNRYPIEDLLKTKSIGPSKDLYHYDLYRLEKGDDTTSIGLEESFENMSAINVVEWADRLGELPDKYIRIDFETKESEHEITIEFVDPEVVPEDAVEGFYVEWETPQNVKNHCTQVASVAKKIGEALVNSGEIVNLTSIFTANSLHDVARICDMAEIDEESRFEQEVTKDIRQKWCKLRDKHNMEHHAEIACKFFDKKGFAATAELIRLHRATAISLEPESFNTWEAKLMCYADKRVKHDEIVDLDERFKDGRERYGWHNDEKRTALYTDVEKRVYALEKNLFKNLDIKPEDIK